MPISLHIFLKNCRSRVSPPEIGTISHPRPARTARRSPSHPTAADIWDLYLLDLTSGDTSQLTDTPDYEGAPTWSPDGAFMAFEAYVDDNLEIVVGPARRAAE